MKEQSKSKIKIFTLAIIIVLLYHNINHVKDFVQGFIDGF
jgi:hypothetical protein